MNPNQQPYPPQPYPYPPQGYAPYPPQAPKQPMDPAKKKKLIIGLSVGGGALVLAIAAIILVPILLKTDYSTAYNTAKELKPLVAEAYYNTDCERVVDYVDSDYYSVKDYSSAVETCKKLWSDIAPKVSDLEETTGVKRDDNLNQKFYDFKTAYEQIAPDADALAERLELYKVWHSFVVAIDDFGWNQTDAELTQAANILINSGNETLANYGTGWLEKRKAAAEAYRAYNNRSGYSSELLQKYYDAQTDAKNYDSSTKPSITEVAGEINTETGTMYNNFSTFYDALTDTYEANYNYGSGDCTEFSELVYCE